MEKYKINKNPKPLSDEQINRHKDFNTLLTNQKKLYKYKDATKPLYRKTGFMSLVILISVVILLLFIESKEAESTEQQDSVSVKKADIEITTTIQKDETSAENKNVSKVSSTSTAKAIGSAAVVYETFKINPEKGAVLYTNSGARIVVPNFAFFNEKGNVTKEEITLYFKEFRSLEEANIDKKTFNENPFLLFEMKAEESISKTSVTLTQAIECEFTTAIKDKEALVYCFIEKTKTWEQKGKEKFSYRFTNQFNKTDYPELTILEGLLWELPETSGKPSDFGYIFNRPWKNLIYTASTKKELQLKNKNTTFKSISDFGALVPIKKENEKLIEAYTCLFNNSTGKIQNKEQVTNANQLINNWKSSPEGKAYATWVNSKNANDQYFSDRKTSKIAIKTLGITTLATTSSTKMTTSAYKRILVLQRYPEKEQHFSKEEIQREPSLKR